MLTGRMIRKQRRMIKRIPIFYLTEMFWIQNSLKMRNCLKSRKSPLFLQNLCLMKFRHFWMQ